MSGPAVIQALGGRQELDAEDTQAVTALMGGAARVRLQPTDRLCADRTGDFRQAVLEWILQRDAEKHLDLHNQHNQLGTRLLERGMAPSPLSNVEPPPEALLQVMPPGFHARTIDGVLIGRTTKASPDTFFGLVSKEPVGALALWTLAGACLSAADSRPSEAVMLLLDAPGQAATLRDERIMLSQYVAHLALVLSHVRQRGQRVTLQVLGEAAGGIYVALAAPATRVVALPGANVQMLPPTAMARVIGRHGARGNVDDYLRAGVVDTII